MPLEQRVLQPIYASRGIIDEHKNIYNLLPNELECFANETMVNMIKQLSSLSLYAEDLFGSILQDAGNLIIRTNTLQQKIDNLTIRVTQLDSTNDDISLHDIHLKKPYKPPNDTVQEIFSKKTLPKSVLELYYQCSKPPPLHLLNPFRDDGKDSMKFYTNPHFFFELWREVMLKQVEKEKNNKKLAQRPASKLHNSSDKERKPRQPANTNERFRKMISQQEFLVGDDINNKNIIYMTSNEVHHGQYNHLNDKQTDVYGTYNGTINHQGHYYSTNNFNPPSYYGTIKNGNYSRQITGDYVDNKVIQNNINNSTKKNYQNHPNQPNNVPYHLQQAHHHQMNGNYADSLTPPPPYNQLNQQDLNNHLQNSMQTLSKRSNLTANRPSQPPPQPPPINGNMNNEYHQPNGYVNHYSETNLNQQNLNNMNSQNELLSSKNRSSSLSRDILPPPPPIPNANNENSTNILPPPPPPAMTTQSTNGNISQNKKNSDVVSSNVIAPPPPPPPPPMPSLDVTDDIKPSVSASKTVKKPVEFSFEQEILQKHKQLQPPKIINKPGPASDPRNDLLASIREGIKLRRVEDSKQKEVEKSNLLDVASILARRVAMELSDSETEASENSESDGWDDETEC